MLLKKGLHFLIYKNKAQYAQLQLATKLVNLLDGPDRNNINPVLKYHIYHADYCLNRKFFCCYCQNVVSFLWYLMITTWFCHLKLFMVSKPDQGATKRVK